MHEIVLWDLYCMYYNKSNQIQGAQSGQKIHSRQMCATYIYIFMLGYNHHHINDDDAGQMMTKKLSVKAVPRRRTLLRTPEGSHQTATQLLQQCKSVKIRKGTGHHFVTSILSSIIIGKWGCGWFLTIENNKPKNPRCLFKKEQQGTVFTFSHLFSSSNQWKLIFWSTSRIWIKLVRNFLSN